MLHRPLCRLYPQRRMAGPMYRSGAGMLPGNRRRDRCFPSFFRPLHWLVGNSVLQRYQHDRHEHAEPDAPNEHQWIGSLWPSAPTEKLRSICSIYLPCFQLSKMLKCLTSFRSASLIIIKIQDIANVMVFIRQTVWGPIGRRTSIITGADGILAQISNGAVVLDLTGWT